MPFIQTHLQILIEANYLPQQEVGINAMLWWQSVCPHCREIPTVLNRRFNRDSLFELCKSSEVDTQTKIIAIMAWGSMRRNNARLALINNNALLAACNEIQRGNISRGEVFNRFIDLRRTAYLKGIGIAYFTKLMYFLNASEPNNWYILDQWTAKSINLLCGQDIVLISNNTVSNKNTVNNYNLFCDKIDELAMELNLSGGETEELIFSKGGKNRGKWREHVDALS